MAFGGGGQLGSVHYDVEVRLDRFESDLNRARSAANRFSSDVGRSLTISGAEQGIGRSAGGISGHMASIGRGAATAGRGFNTGMNVIRTSVGRAEGAIFNLQNAAVALGGALAVREIIQYGDAWKLGQDRLRLATGSTEELAQVTDQLFDVAQRTRSAMDPIVGLYSRMEQATRHLGMSSGELVGITESVAQAIMISGTSAQGAAAVIEQFAQALSEGAFRGDELNTISGQSNRLLQALIAGYQELYPEIGLTNENYRKLASEGILTTDKNLRALTTQQAVLSKEAATMSTTVSGAFQQIDNALGRLIGTQLDATGASSGLADAMSQFAIFLGSDETVAAVDEITDSLGRFMDRMANAIRVFGAIGDSIRGFTQGLRDAADNIPVIGGLLQRAREGMGTQDQPISEWGRLGNRPDPKTFQIPDFFEERKTFERAPTGGAGGAAAGTGADDAAAKKAVQDYNSRLQSVQEAIRKATFEINSAGLPEAAQEVFATLSEFGIDVSKFSFDEPAGEINKLTDQFIALIPELERVRQAAEIGDVIQGMQQELEAGAASTDAYRALNEMFQEIGVNARVVGEELQLEGLSDEIATAAQEAFNLATRLNEAAQATGLADAIKDMNQQIAAGAGGTEQYRELNALFQELGINAQVVGEKLQFSGLSEKLGAAVQEAFDLKTELGEIEIDEEKAEKFKDALAEIKEETRAIGGAAEDIEDLNKLFEELGINAQAFADALIIGAHNTELQTQRAKEAYEATQTKITREKEFEAATAKTNVVLEAQATGARIISGELTQAVMGAQSFGEAMANIAQRIAEAVIEALIFASIMRLTAGPTAGIVGGIGGAPYAKGGVFQDGRVVPMARGGLIMGPTIRPMADGSTALMGEAGPEAVVPLERIGGKLGINAAGMGGSKTEVHIHPPANTQGRAEKSRDGGRVDVFFDEMMAANMRPGTRTAKALQARFGVKPSAGSV